MHFNDINFQDTVSRKHWRSRKLFYGKDQFIKRVVWSPGASLLSRVYKRNCWNAGGSFRLFRMSNRLDLRLRKSASNKSHVNRPSSWSRLGPWSRRRWTQWDYKFREALFSFRRFKKKLVPFFITELLGIDKQNSVGFLAYLEHLQYCEVGAFLKSPSHPVWVLGSETHLTVLFSPERDIVRPETPAEMAKRIFNKYSPDGNNFIQTTLLQDVLAELNLVNDSE